jgi:hypothetical protein
VKDLQKKFNRSVYPYSCANNRGKSWQLEEDAMIIHMVTIMGSKSWASIAESLAEHWPENKYSPKQIRERWCNHLDPNVNKGPWSIEEECTLLDFVLKSGRQWSLVGKVLKGRTEHNIKNRYKSLQKRAKREFGSKANREKLLAEKLRAEIP